MYIPGSFKCQFCTKVCSSKDGLRLHMLLHQDRKSFKCSECEHTSHRLEYLEQHIKKRHTVQEKNVSCDICDRKFYNKVALKHHQKIHDENRQKFTCPECSAVLLGKARFRQHVAKHFGKVKKKERVPCPVCNKLITDVNKHMRLTHAQREKCCCPTCGQTFTYKAAMRKHMSIHLGQSKTRCTICGNQYVDIHKHMKNHEGKMYTCQEITSLRCIDAYRYVLRCIMIDHDKNNRFSISFT